MDFFFFILPHHAACGILAHQPGIETVQSLNHWTAREVPQMCSFSRSWKFFFFFLPVNNLVFYLPKASCCRRWGPKTSRRDEGWGGEPSCLPAAACPILLPAGDGRVEKVCPCTIKYFSCVCVSVAQSYPTLATPWTVAHQAPLSKGFSRQEYWRGLPFPSSGSNF